MATAASPSSPPPEVSLSESQNLPQLIPLEQVWSNRPAPPPPPPPPSDEDEGVQLDNDEEEEEFPTPPGGVGETLTRLRRRAEEEFRPRSAITRRAEEFPTPPGGVGETLRRLRRAGEEFGPRTSAITRRADNDEEEEEEEEFSRPPPRSRTRRTQEKVNNNNKSRRQTAQEIVDKARRRYQPHQPRYFNHMCDKEISLVKNVKKFRNGKNMRVANANTVHLYNYRYEKLKLLVGKLHRTQNILQQQYNIDMSIPSERTMKWNLPITITGYNSKLLLESLCEIERIVY